MPGRSRKMVKPERSAPGVKAKHAPEDEWPDADAYLYFFAQRLELSNTELAIRPGYARCGCMAAHPKEYLEEIAQFAEEVTAARKKSLV